MPGHLDRLNQTRLLPLEQLLQVTHQSPMYNERERRSIFYAQSWALTHMIVLGQPPRAEKLAAYLERGATGATERAAWDAVSGADRLDRALEDYIQRTVFQAFRFKFSEKLAAIDTPVVPVSEADAEGFLANFLLQQSGREEEAAARLEKVRAKGEIRHDFAPCGL